MAEPHFNPDSSQSASDEALEQALEKVRREARARAREQRERHASAIVAEAAPRRAAPARSRAESPRTADKPHRDDSHQAASRPSIWFALAVVLIAAIGFVGIQTIHATTPAIEGFASSNPDDAQSADLRVSTDDNNTDLTSPVTAALMRTQGWVLPSMVSTIDPALEKIRAAEYPGVPSEIAQVPALEMDVDPAQELATLTATAAEPEYNEELPLPPPPPPVFGPGGSFPGSALGGGPAGAGFAGGNALALPALPGATAAAGDSPLTDNSGVPLGDNQAAPLPIPGGSMLEDINRSAPPSAPAPTQQARAPEAPTSAVAPPPASLASLQEQKCSRLGFFSRISCKDDLRQEFCANRWNQHPECTRVERSNNF